MEGDLAHSKNGNCFEGSYSCRRCGIGNLCDVCHKHDEPRGECSTCEPCKVCEKELK